MSTFKKFNLSGQEVGSVEVDETFFNVEAHPQMVKDYIVALRANARQWSASTKGRSEVVHTTKKPHRQKGTGAARQGSLVSPQYRGGGIVFGPKPKFNQHVRINKKERRQAIRGLLAEKAKENQLIVVEDKTFKGALKEPKTKSIAEFLKMFSLFGRRVLFVGEGSFEEVEIEDKKEKVAVHSQDFNVFKMSMRNIPKAAFSLAPNLNGYDLAAARMIIVSESALKQLQEILN